MFGKNNREDLKSAVNIAYGTPVTDDCAHLVFEPGNDQFTVQSLYPDDDEPQINVTGLTVAARERLRSEVDLEVLDVGPNSIMFEGKAESPGEAVGEVVKIVEAYGADLSDVTVTKTFTAGEETVRANLKAMWSDLVGDRSLDLVWCLLLEHRYVIHTEYKLENDTGRALYGDLCKRCGKFKPREDGKERFIEASENQTTVVLNGGNGDGGRS